LAASPPLNAAGASSVARREADARMKKPRSDAGLFHIPIPPSGALPPGGIETFTGCGKNPIATHFLLLLTV
jgi:hypothetical protein